MAAHISSTSTPEYVTFRKCYPTIVHYVKEQPGAFCDVLFANSFIPPTVRDYARNRYINDEEKAQKITDTLIDRVQQDPSVFHGLIRIVEGDGPWADDFAQKLKTFYEAEKKQQQQTKHTETAEKDENHYSSDDSFHSATGPDQSSLETKFPYLDVSSLSEHEKADLEVQLRSDIRSIKSKFSDFRVAVRDSLRSRIPLDDIKDSILSLDAFTDGIGVGVLDPIDAQKIESAESLSRVFMTLRTYISFFNYEIIERLITQYGTNDDKKQLQDYYKELDTFCQRNVYEIPPNALSNPRPEAKELVLKCTQDTLTLHDVRAIKEKAARILGLQYSTLQLHTIEKGCVELHFLISAAVANHIFPVSPSQHSALSEIGVTIFLLDDAQTELWSDPSYPGSIGSRDFLLIKGDDLVTTDPDVVPRRSRGPLTEEERRKLEEQGIHRDYHHSDESIVMARYQLDKECNIVGQITGGANEVMMQIENTMKQTSREGGKLHTSHILCYIIMTLT